MAPNQALSFLALFLTVAGIFWFGCLKKPERLLPAAMLLGPLFLPPWRSIPLPGWALEKVSAISMPAICLLTMIPARRWREMRLFLPDIFLLLFVAWNVVACASNLSAYSGVYRGIHLLMHMVVPWLVGKLCLNSEEDLRALVGTIWWVPIFYCAAAVLEAIKGPTFSAIIYGESGPLMPRGFLFRPPVFTLHSLEMGNFIGLLALLLGASLYSKFLDDDRALRDRARLGFVAAIVCVGITQSRGPITALGLGVFVVLFLRHVNLLYSALASGGVALFFWMMSPYGSGHAVGSMVASGGDQLAVNLFFRFQQIDIFKTMMDGKELLGWGESWPRTQSIKTIDGQLLLITLGTGYVGAILISLHWVTAGYWAARGSHARSHVWHWLGAGFAGMLAFLTFSAWGDSFIRSQHFLLIGAIPAALARLKLAEARELDGDVKEARWQFG